jgi:hypothetical protein
MPRLTVAEPLTCAVPEVVVVDVVVVDVVVVDVVILETLSAPLVALADPASLLAVTVQERLWPSSAPCTV